ncbi:Kelch repeat-containing protein [Corallococcus exercitus]|uniref:Kelch repeat-containing protein n=1 Tax=Corallococcus exercitus TaxID=2316736 RepID=UPI0035D40F75
MPRAGQPGKKTRYAFGGVGNTLPRLFFDTVHGGLVVFGGQRFDGLSSDLWFYSVKDNRWTEVAFASGSPIPPARVGGISSVRETPTTYELYLNGGASSDGGASEFFDDLWKLTWLKR